MLRSTLLNMKIPPGLQVLIRTDEIFKVLKLSVIESVQNVALNVPQVVS